MPEDIDNQPEGEETDTWTGPTQEEWQAMTETLGYLAQNYQNAYAPDKEPTTPTAEQQKQYNLDPFSDQYQSDLQNLIRDTVTESVAPYSQFTQEQVLQEAEERASDIIHSLEQENGNLPKGGQAFVRALANEYIDDAQEQYGFGPQAAEAALEAAYSEAKQIFEQANKEYYEKQMDELGTVAGARREPDATTPAAQGSNHVKGDEMALVRNMFGSR